MIDLTSDELYDGVIGGDRAVIGRAITLVESSQDGHQRRAQELLQRLLPHAGAAHRVGITGVPGVGKSTFIDELGSRLTKAGRSVAVLAVDPTSTRTGGSILGDKTRMARLAVDPKAFIRPSPTTGTLGGVSRRTRETSTIVEAAGYDVVLIETVGVGQSETVVADMVDFFLVLLLPGAGDELQGIKKGVLELADMVAVNKADGAAEMAALHAAADYSSALRLVQPTSRTWTPPVVTCSGQTGEGIDSLWATVEEHRVAFMASGEFAARRRSQRVGGLWATVEDRILSILRTDDKSAALMSGLEAAVENNEITPTAAADTLVASFMSTADGTRTDRTGQQPGSTWRGPLIQDG